MPPKIQGTTGPLTKSLPSGPGESSRPSARPSRSSIRPASHPLQSRAPQAPLTGITKPKPQGIGKSIHDLATGRKASGAAMVLGTSGAEQGPKDGRRVAKLAEMDQATRLERERGSIHGAGTELQERLDAVGQASHTSPPRKHKLRKAINTAIAATGLHPGGKLSYTETAHLYRPGRSKAGAGEHRVKALTQAVMQLLAANAAAERAQVAHDLAQAVHLPRHAGETDGPMLGRILSPEYRAALDATKHDALEKAKQPAIEVRKALMDEALGVTAAPHREQIQAALGKLFDRLDAGQPAPDALAGQLLTNTATRLFAGQPKQAAQALEGLLAASLDDLTKRSATAIRVLGEPADPTLRLAAELSSQAGGRQRLTRLLANEKAPEAHKQAAGVALASLHEMASIARRDQRPSPRQAQWLTAATDHAARVAGADHHVPLGRDASRLRHIAYRAVQNGLMTDEPGSAYARLNERLPNIGSRWLQQAAARNERAARGRGGRLQNLAGAAAPRWMGGPSSSPIRKSVLRRTVRAAARNGMLPTRTETLVALGKSARSMTQLIGRARSEHPRAAGNRQDVAERLMLAVLAAVEPQDQAPAKKAVRHLGEPFFDGLEAALGGHSLAALGESFKAEWTQLRQSRPNAGHVLAMLTEHVDLRHIAHDTPEASAPRSIAARGEHADHIATAAVKSFQALAGHLQAHVATLAEDTASAPLRALASLTVELGSALAGVKPAAVLANVRQDTFTKLEAKLGDALDKLPQELQAKWSALVPTNPDAGQVMGLVHEALPKLLGDKMGADPELGAALEDAGKHLLQVRRDVHINRFERAVADTITGFADVRTPRDLAAVIESTSQRVSLAEKIRSGDGRVTGANVGKLVSFAFAVPDAVFTPILAAAYGTERSLDLNMNGAALQAFIGETHGGSVSAGLKVGLRGDLGEADHEFNIGEESGIALRAEIKAEGGFESMHMNGVTLRVRRTGGHEDVLRRQLASALVDVAHPQSLLDGEHAYPDMMAALLDRHPHLVLTEIDQERSATKGELSAGLTAMGRFRGPDRLDEGQRSQNRRAAGLGASVGLGSKTERGTSATREARSALSIDEFKVSARQRIEARAAGSMPLSLMSAADQTEGAGAIYEKKKHSWVPSTPGLSTDRTLQIRNSGDELMLRVTTADGALWADQTQRVSEHESLDDWLARVGPESPHTLKILAARDTTAGRSAAEKLAVAFHRRDDLVQQMAEGAGPNTVFSATDKLRPEAANAWDSLLALAQEAEAGGADDAEIATYQDALRSLAFHSDSWTPFNLQVKTKSKSEAGVSLPFRTAKATGEATRLQEFYPATAQNVGRHENMPIRPLNLWSSRLETVPEAISEDRPSSASFHTAGSRLSAASDSGSAPSFATARTSLSTTDSPTPPDSPATGRGAEGPGWPLRAPPFRAAMESARTGGAGSQTSPRGLPPIAVRQLRQAMSMLQSARQHGGRETVADVAEMLGLPAGTLSRYLAESGRLQQTPELAAWAEGLPEALRTELSKLGG